MKNRFIFGMTMLLILSTYQIQDNFSLNFNLNIKEIIMNNQS